MVLAHTRNGLSIAAVDVTQRFDYDLAGRLQKRRFENINGGTRTLDYNLLAGWLAKEQAARR